MPIYNYKAYDAKAAIKKGTHDATSKKEVLQYLRTNELYPIEIKLTRLSKKNEGKTSGGSQWFAGLKNLIPFKGNYHNQLTVMTRQLETLLAVTIPYDKAIGMIMTQTTDESFKHVLSDIRSRVVEGAHLAEAMENHSHIFSTMYTSMVRAGENSGTLEMIMNRLANYYEGQQKLRSKLKSAMIYPIFMLIFGFAAVMFMTLVIVPKITTLFESRNAVLPLVTRILIGFSDFILNHWFITTIIIAIVIGSLSYFMRTPMGIILQNKLAITLPFIKVLKIKIMVLRFCQTLGTLLKSGVDLKSALEISKHVVANHVFLEKLDKLIVDVNNKGVPLSGAMKRISFFPEYVCHVVAIGEQAAKVDELLEQVAERMQMEVSNTLDGLSSLLEPIMILLMGGIVAFIALAIMLPMLTMNQLL